VKTAIRTKAATLLLTATAAAALGLGALTASPASADTFPGPAGSAGADVLPDNGEIGNPANISKNGTDNQVIEDAYDSSAWGSQARTFGANGSNAQRVYFKRVDSRTLVYDAGSGAATVQGMGAYKILHYTASGSVLCLDADGSHGAPGAGATVSWYACDPNSPNQANQLWTIAPVSGRVNDNGTAPNALVNLGSLPDPHYMDVRNAPILTASANAQGTDSPLSLQSQGNATVSNSAWTLRNLMP
jgi:hypothetical protein